MNPKLSIIITSHNNGDYLKICLDSLIKSADLSDKEIIVMDDFSHDNTKDIIKEYTKKIPMLVVLSSNYKQGLAISSNVACSYANSELLLIMNEDAVFPSDWEGTFLPLAKRGWLISTNNIEPGKHVTVAEGFTKKNFGVTAKEFKYDDFIKFEKSIRKDFSKVCSNGPQLIYKNDYMKIGGCDPLFCDVPLVDTDFFIKCSLAGIKFKRTYTCAFYHFSGKGGRLKGDSKEPNIEFITNENLNLNRFRAKWGFVPYAVNGLWKAPNEIIRGVDFRSSD